MLQLLYERAFWRDRGYSGEVVCDTPHHSAPIFNVFDFCKTRADVRFVNRASALGVVVR